MRDFEQKLTALHMRVHKARETGTLNRDWWAVTLFVTFAIKVGGLEMLGLTLIFEPRYR